MTATVRDLGPYLALVLVGFLPNEIWRVLGIVIARGLDESSELLVWVRAVATAVLAGIIAQLILTPPGALATVSISLPSKPLRRHRPGVWWRELAFRRRVMWPPLARHHVGCLPRSASIRGSGGP